MGFDQQRPANSGDTKLSEIALDQALPLLTGSGPQSNMLDTTTAAFQALSEIARRQNIIMRSSDVVYWDSSTGNIWFNADPSSATNIILEVLGTESIAYPTFQVELQGSLTTNGANTFMNIPMSDGELCYLELNSSLFVGQTGSPFILANAVNGGGLTVGARVLTVPMTTAMPQMQIGFTGSGSLFYIPLALRRGTNLYWLPNGQMWPAGNISMLGIFNALVNPMTTGGDMIYGGVAGTPERLPNGDFGQLLMSGGGTSAPAWTTPLAPCIQTLTSGMGSWTVPYYFSVTSANATAGATYTNNGQTFTVVNTISGGTTLLCTSTGAATSSGTLTLSGGMGDATIAFSATLAPSYLIVEMVGGAGGGSGGGDGGFGGGQQGGSGTNTEFGSSFLLAGAGSGGQVGGGGNGGNGGNGGVNSALPAGVTGISINGGSGDPTRISYIGVGGGGMGGVSPFGGAGGGSAFNPSTKSPSAVPNSGSGGGGGSAEATPSVAGSGGGAGGYIRAVVTSPSASYPYTVGTGGIAGNAGSAGTQGGTGGSGIIIITACFS